MGYYIDLTRISLDKLKEKLKTEDLLPSQQILKKNIDERFEIIKSQNLKTVSDLKSALKTKKEVKQFSSKTSLPENFLIVLRREINSYHPQPRKIEDFPEISDSTKKKLQNMGIKTTIELYDMIITKEKRKKLEKELKISNEEILLLTKLTDLSRIRYVNQTFATLLTNSEYDTVKKIKKADYKKLYESLLKINESKNIFKGKIKIKDMNFLIKEAMIVPVEIEY
jgi:hypothetical protein